MVFKTLQLLGRCRGPDEFWRKRKIFKLAAHFKGRARNCYSLAVRAVHRSLQYATIGRTLKKRDFHQLWNARLKAGCKEQNVSSNELIDSLQKYDVLLNRKTLTELAAWEPRTFRSIVNIGAARTEKIDISNAEAKHIFLTDNPDDYERKINK